MSHRFFNALVATALVAATLGAGVIESQIRLSHPGTIVDAHNGNGIAAEATAYEMEAPTVDLSCPKHINQLDQTTSIPPIGTFTFGIDAKYARYFAEYCSTGYAHRSVPANENTQNNSRVQPDPVKLYRSQARLTDALQAIRRTLDQASSDLRYFTRVDKGGMAEALNALTPQEKQAVEILLNRNFAVAN